MPFVDYRNPETNFPLCCKDIKCSIRSLRISNINPVALFERILLWYSMTMNPFEVYKKLPRKNCGKCSAGTCMAFAVQFLRRFVTSSECTELDERGRQEIDAMIPDAGDWKERRLQGLFNEISGKNFSDVAGGIGASYAKGSLKIRYMGKDVVVTPSAFNEELTVEDKLLILMYIKNAGRSPLAGRWVAFRDLKDGLIRAESFHEACEQSLAAVFGRDPDGFLKKLYALDARDVPGFSAKHSLVMHPLPKIPFLILLWPGDDEFEPDCKILFDSTVTEFIDVEALLYLGIALVRAAGK